jgi:hypothetical protein
MGTKQEQEVTGYEVTTVSRLVGNLLSVCFCYVNREMVTVVTSCYGKLIMGVKSLILLLLTNLPRLTPYRGYRGVVSNPPPPPIFFLASSTINCSVLVSSTYKIKRDKTHSTSRGWEKEQKKQSKAKDRRFNKQLTKERQ